MGKITTEDALQLKIQEIIARKATDRVSNYAVSENKETGETILDFMLSDGTGENLIMEWNIYRYAPYKDAKGQEGISLFSLSKRDYGAGIAQFGPEFRDNRKKYLADFSAFPRPVITLK